MKILQKKWWLVLIKGILLIVLAFYTFMHPATALVGLALYIGITLLITGLALVFISISVRKEDENWGWRLGEGALDILFALIMLSSPVLTAAVIPFIVGFWIMVYGVMIVAGSFKTKSEGVSNWWTILLGGLITIFVGYNIVTNLFVGAFSITVWFGIGFLVAGLVNISIALKIKKAKDLVEEI